VDICITLFVNDRAYNHSAYNFIKILAILTYKTILIIN